VLTYRLRRARRRSIGFQIDDQGLTVSARRWVRCAKSSPRSARSALDPHQAARCTSGVKRRLPPVRLLTVPRFLPGGRVTLRLAATSTATHHADGELRVALPLDANELQWRDAVQAWLQAKPGAYSTSVSNASPPHQRRYAGWTLSSARSQWVHARTMAASASAGGSFTLHCG